VGHRRSAANVRISGPPPRPSAAPPPAAATPGETGLDGLFFALSDPIRRGILAQLAQGPCSVTALGAPFPVTPPAISKHLMVLERSGLIERWKEGRVHFCRLNAAPLRQAGTWIEQYQAFWERQLDALEEYLDAETTTCGEARPTRSIPKSC
jgi:DNA-binding transcriptional ArsR family regulator